MKVLVTDGHLKAALSAVRHLGRLGIEVHTTKSIEGPTVSFFSRFNRKTHWLPTPGSKDFDRLLLSLLQRERFDYLFPVSDLTLQRISINREAVARLVRIDLPPRESLDLVLSKSGLLRAAQEMGIAIPKTVVYRGDGESQTHLKELSFPIVAKSFPGETYDRVKYINSVHELDSFISNSKSASSILFQEYIEGTGHGFFAFFENGKPILSHMHERIWEYPVTGGPSVFARTIDDPALQELGTRLLEHLNWNGVAMVEFKKAKKDGTYTLMEINPRLWGSLDLTIASGTDVLSIALAEDRVAAAKLMPPAKASFLWVMPDSVLFLLSQPKKLFRFLQVLFAADVRTDVQTDDLWPLVHQLREALYWTKILIPKGRLRYPHGRPESGVSRPIGGVEMEEASGAVQGNSFQYPIAKKQPTVIRSSPIRPNELGDAAARREEVSIKKAAHGS